MNTLTQKQIGERVKKARELSHLSQDALANALRLAVTQIENGQRKLSGQELMPCANILNFSLDDFTATNFLDRILDSQAQTLGTNQTERISISGLRIDKFKTVLLYILERCSCKPNIGETALNKLLYFSNFNYYELYEEQLTGAEYKNYHLAPYQKP